MTLTSLPFYLLVLALLVLYYLVPKRFQWVVLLIGSYAFYAFVCLRYMGFIVVTTLTTYFGARGMDAMTARMEQTVAAHKQDWEREERKAYKKRCKSRRKALMIAILLLNFGILAVLKYYNFFAESMEALFASVGLTVSLGHIGLLLPLGISFYTFQSMGYVLDVYREKCPPSVTSASSRCSCPSSRRSFRARSVCTTSWRTSSMTSTSITLTTSASARS